MSYNKYIIIILQVLLVTGGFVGNAKYLDSTEILEEKKWTITAPLPSARYDLRAASIDNKILVFGKNIFIFHNIQYYNFKYLM